MLAATVSGRLVFTTTGANGVTRFVGGGSEGCATITGRGAATGAFVTAVTVGRVGATALGAGLRECHQTKPMIPATSRRNSQKKKFRLM